MTSRQISLIYEVEQNITMQPTKHTESVKKKKGGGVVV